MAREIDTVPRKKRKTGPEITNGSQIMLETPSTEFLEALISEEELDNYLAQVHNYESVFTIDLNFRKN